MSTSLLAPPRPTALPDPTATIIPEEILAMFADGEPSPSFYPIEYVTAPF